MPVQSVPKPTTGRELMWLAAMNGASVSTLYWAQSLMGRATAEFGPSPVVQLMPGATLAGYAAGVALLAAVARDLTSPSGFVLHLLVLATGLCAAASASAPLIALVACLVIGVGCSLTQRLLVCATSAVPPEARSQTIGWIIASGLFGIVFARACVSPASAALGWHAMFWLDAVIITALGLAVISTREPTDRLPQPRSLPPLPTVTALWRREKSLRQAALQQAAVFAAFNLGWALYPRILHMDGVEPSIPMGLVASLGTGAAILSGRLCARHSPAQVAAIGLLMGASAITLLVTTCFLAAGRALGSDVLLMACLDVGTQLALVANQARAQALASSPAMRGRITAIVTTIGFAGGALGAALGNLLH